MHIAIYDDKHTLSQHAAEYIMQIAKEAIDLHGRFTIALTGGTTPGEAYSLLGSEPIRSQIDWQRVHIFWGDERCVPHTNSESNFYLAQEVLFDKVAIPNSQIHPMPADQPNCDEAGSRARVQLRVP
ncbi:MAG: 6-phosphogluconolactonase, partial [Ktedonobacteraceae bacterium]